VDGGPLSGQGSAVEFASGAMGVLDLPVGTDILPPGQTLEDVALTDFKTLVVVLPVSFYSCEELDLIREFINTGGRVVIFYEDETYNSFQENLPSFVVNTFLEALGSTMRVQVGTVGGPQSRTSGLIDESTPITFPFGAPDEFCH
jgi:hypothetical protein